MKRLTLAIIFLTSMSCLFAQPPRDRERIRQELEARKIAYITAELELTPAQAEKFWPIYNEYSAARKQIKKQMRKMRHQTKENINSSDEKDLQKQLDKFFELKQKEIDLDNQYKDKLLKVISIKQLLNLYRAEKEFLHKLREKINERQGHRPPPDYRDE